MPVTHQPSVTIIGKFVGMAAEEAGNLGLHGMRQQRSRAVAQNLGQWVGKGPWLRQPDDIILGHGVSLLWWRSGGVEHPHDTPPYPFTPSPTSAHNSIRPHDSLIESLRNEIGIDLKAAREFTMKLSGFCATNLGRASFNADEPIEHRDTIFDQSFS